ncbi:MAG: cell wall-binding repeat-containing protein, partial [Fusobacterium sp.]|nr:cell wall-binding repeat-containing protein [Fusobacterium sp.]
KKYIEINKSDFDNKAEEILENIEFNFNFHNCNGKDNRTKGKFNGKVTFKATLKAPEVAKYNATYSFESATEGKQLPKEVTDLLPNDDKEYEEGNKITALNPNPDKVEVADGIWIFKGYVDKNGNQITEQLANKENANEKGNIHFKGNWEFNEKEKQDATVKYEFVNATPKDNTNPDIDLSKMPIPNEVMNVKPNDTTAYKVGDEVEVKEPETKDFRVTYEDPEKNIKTQMDWQFQGYWVNGKETNKIEELSAGENVFEGRWECKDIDRVSYKFISDDGTVLPDTVMEKIPTPHHGGIYYDNQQIIPQKPESLKIEVDNGTWTFLGWNKNIIEHIHKDTVFVGKWYFTPKDTSGGTTPDKPEIPDKPNKPVTPNKPILPNKPTEPDRVEGDDRIETSIEASKNLFPSGTNAVVLSNCERFTDVLTANPFAIQENASALLTYKDKLPEKTLKEIERLGAKKIYISGGYEAVSKEVVDELISKGYDVFRFDGKDRYDTARKIAIKIREKGKKEVIELASGENFPDALSMTSMAVKDKAPILLTKKDSIPKYTKQALAEWDVENVKIAGLDKAISKEVEKQIDEGFKIDKDKKDDSNVYDGAKSINRFGGKDRYETSTIIAANSCPMSKLGVYATGENFPDALIAGNYAGRKNAPVLLVKRDTLPEVVRNYTEKSDIERITVIGGVNAVSDEVFELIKEAIK